MAEYRKMLERKQIGKSEAILEIISIDFPNAFAPKSQVAVGHSLFRIRVHPPSNNKRRLGNAF
jgi:hypothetical protein